MRQTLEQKGLLDDTLVVLYGDHGDDCWTHGYKGGMIHGTEPYTEIIATPFAIRDSSLEPGMRSDLSITDHTYTLMASSRGLEMYAHRLDPGNHFNLLHFFALDSGGQLVPHQNA